MNLQDMLNTSGIKALYDMTTADTAKIVELQKQEKEGKPIDLDMAREVVAHIDLYMDGLAQMSWSQRMMLQQGKFKKIQKEAHDHLKILEEKSKVQGLIQHTVTGDIIIQTPEVKETIKEPETQIQPKVQVEIQKVKEVPQGITPVSEVKEEVAIETNISKLPDGLQNLLKEYQVTPAADEGFQPIEKEGYIKLTQIWNTRLSEASAKAYELGQTELLNAMTANYEGFGSNTQEVVK